jgi:TfoX/Sxy family transcriptional regulator of competence genes
MASTQSFVEYVCEQAGSDGAVSSRKMFGEYALYLQGKLVALVCDDHVFVKPTAEGRRLLVQPKEVAPYPGAKPCLWVTSLIDNRALLTSLFSATAAALPAPKPKKSSGKEHRKTATGSKGNVTRQ